MSDGARPWWASEDGTETAAPEPDPLGAHRAARRGAPADPPATDPQPDADAWWEPAAEAVARLARDLADAGDAARSGPVGANGSDGAGPRPDAEGTGGAPPGRLSEDRTGGGGTEHRPEVCGVCPICVGLRALGDARPELVAHLTAAARHLAAAVRSLVEPPETDPSRPDGGFERIDLDG